MLRRRLDAEKAAKILGTMAIREVLKMGDPRLLEVAQPVAAFGTPELEALLHDMRDTMQDLNGAGLAAPQIGVGLRVVIFGIEANPRYPDAEEVPFTVLINPELTPLGDEMEEGWEGCLSVPGHARTRAALSAAALHRRRMRPAGRSTARSATSMRAWCSTRSTISTASSIPRRIRDLTQFGFTEALFPGQDVLDD